MEWNFLFSKRSFHIAQVVSNASDLSDFLKARCLTEQTILFLQEEDILSLKTFKMLKIDHFQNMLK